MQARIRLDHTLLAIEGEHRVHAMLELVAPDVRDAGRRPALGLALVLDRSGSMAGPKLEVARRCAAWVVERLAPSDRVAVVAYDDEVTLVAPLAPPEPARLAGAIAAIAPGGMTNLSGGWLKGLEELGREAGAPVRKVVLLTDGLANVGITEPAILADAARAAAEAGVGTSTIGLGTGFDEDLLTALSDAGGGGAHFAETPDAAPAIFAAELDGLASVVAQNVSVEVRPGPGVTAVGALNDHPATPVEGGLQLSLGDAYGGGRRRVVLELAIPHLAALGPARVAELVVRYVAVADGLSHHTLTLPVVVNAVSAEEAARAVPDADVTEEVMLLRAARAQEEAVRRADRGDHAGAGHVLREASAMLAAAPPGSARAEELLRRSRDLADQVDLMSPSGYDATTRKRMRYQSHAARRGRRRPGDR